MTIFSAQEPGPDGRTSNTWLQVVMLLLPVLVLVVVGAVVVIHRSGDGSSPQSTEPPLGQVPTAASVPNASAKALFARSKRAAIAARWVGLNSVQQIGQATLTIVGNAGPTSGQQVLTFAGMTGAERVVGSRSYVDSPAELLSLFAGLSKAEAARVAGRWVEFQKGDPGYGAITAGMTVRSTFAEFTLTRPRIVGLRTESGVQTIEIASRFHKAAHKTETLWISPTGGHLPVRYQATELLHGTPVLIVANFGNWGKAIQLASPPGAVPYRQTRPAVA